MWRQGAAWLREDPAMISSPRAAVDGIIGSARHSPRQLGMTLVLT